MVSLARAVFRGRRLSYALENPLFTIQSFHDRLHANLLGKLPGMYLGVRGLKTTDTVHPEPVYNEDEKVLKKVLEERHKLSDDLPVGMANPFEKPKKKCILCEHGITPNFKNVKLLYQFVSPYTGLTFERHITGLCKTKQEQLEREVKIAYSIGLMSNYLKEVEFLKDPKLCDPERPIRPHKY